MKPKHLIVGAVMTAFSLLALAAPESSPAATPPAGSATTGAAPKAAVNPTKKVKKTEQGKTRGLKSKKGKECETDAGCESGQRK